MRTPGSVLFLLLGAGCAAGAASTEAKPPATPDEWIVYARRRPHSVAAQVYAGYAALHQGDLSAFEEFLERAAARSSKSCCFLATGTLALAGATEEAAAALRPKLLDQAIRFLRKAREAAPRGRDAAYNLGLALYLAGRPAEAVPHLEFAASGRCEDRRFLRLLARCRLAENDAWAALEAAEQQAFDLPLEAEDWELVGECRFHLSRFREAEEAFRRAVERDPERASAWHNLALTLQEQGRPEEAQACRSRAEALRRSTPKPGRKP